MKLTNFLAGWIILQLLAIGLSTGAIYNDIAAGNCDLPKLEPTWRAYMVGIVFPLAAFVPDVNRSEWCRV